MVDELQPYMDPDDIHVHKVRMSGFYGTHLERVMRTQGIETLFFTGVNTDQCVATTMDDAYVRDHNAVLRHGRDLHLEPRLLQGRRRLQHSQVLGVHDDHGFVRPPGRVGTVVVAASGN
jgi:hypothetical protein